MEQFDTLPILCKHIEHMHEGVRFRKSNFWQNDSCEKLDNFSLIRLLYMHIWCRHGPINSYYSFWWNNLILCLFNVDSLNICMKEFGSEKNSFWQNESSENIDNVSLIRLLYMPLWADQLLPQLLVEQLDTLHIQYRHIEHMYEGVWLNFFFVKMTAVRT